MPRKSLAKRFGAALTLGLILLWVPAEAQTIRGHRTHRGSHRHSHGSVRFHHYYSPYYHPYHFGFGWHYLPHGGFYGATGYLPDQGYLDLDVSPEEAEVYLDGEYVGTADDYDGFPAYLPVSPGRHTLLFKAEGHRTVTRRLKVPRGALIDLDFQMPEGVEPEEAVGRPGRAEKQGEIALERELEAEDEEPSDEERGGHSGGGLIRMTVSPADASVYVDGEFLGTGATVSGLHGHLELEPGSHRIEVVKPGYRSVSREIHLAAGDRLALDLTLEPEEKR